MVDSVRCQSEQRRKTVFLVRQLIVDASVCDSTSYCNAVYAKLKVYSIFTFLVNILDLLFKIESEY